MEKSVRHNLIQAKKFQQLAERGGDALHTQDQALARSKEHRDWATAVQKRIAELENEA